MTVDPVEQALDDLAALVAVARREYRAAQSWQVFVAPDGFPSVSGAASRGAPSNELDDDGTPIPQRSDPTLAAVLARDAQKVSLRRIGVLVFAARRSLDTAVGQARASREALEEELPPEVNSPDWCVWHREQLGVNEPIHRGSLCQFCYDWAQASTAEQGTVGGPGARKLPRRPPKRILELRAEGRRITTRVLDEVLGADRRGDRTRRRRRAA